MGLNFKRSILDLYHIYIIIIIIIVGARGPRMKLKSCNIGVGMPQAMGSRRKVTRGEEGMS